jgi:hypothetical protein
VPIKYGANCSGLETFALCDGVNGLIVAINTHDDTLKEATFSIGADIAAELLQWSARVGKQVSIEGQQVTVTLPAHQVAVLYGRTAAADQWDLRDEVSRLQSSVASAAGQGFDTASVRRDLRMTRIFLDAGRRDKALAGLVRVRRSLLVDLQLEGSADEAEVQVRVTSVGRPMPWTSTVELRLPDHGDVRLRLANADKHRWEGTLRRDESLAVYDYRRRCYAPDGGPVAVQAEARAGVCRGASPVVIWKATTGP